jgi:outer membrane biosynthesis protein TonB
MSRELIKQEIAHLLETITEQAETIYEHENKIPQIELDIMLGNVRNLYEQLLALNKIGQLSAPKETVVKPEIATKISVSDMITTIVQDVETPKPQKPAAPAPQPVIETPVVVEQQENIEEKIEIVAANVAAKITVEAPKVQQPIVDAPKIVVPVEQPKPEVKAEPKINIQEEIVVKAAVIEEKHEAEKPVRQKPKTAASLFDAPQSLGEQFDDSQTLKEKISAAKPEKSVAEKFSNQQKIADLKKAIGINEKFLFINELFEGSLASYNEHIDKINASAESNHALSIVDSLVTKYNWNTEQEIVKKFMDLIQRRFL